MAKSGGNGSDRRGGSGTSSTGALFGVVVWYVMAGGLFVWMSVGLIDVPEAGLPLALVGAMGLVMIAVTLPVAALLALRFGDVAQGGESKEMVAILSQMQREAGLSEAAKRVLHRKDERDLLRAAIEQDIAGEEWDAALVLVQELADRFGYRADAEGFRQRIERQRAGAREREIVESMTALDRLIAGRRWADAYAEAARIRRLYPESHHTHQLRERVDEARSSYRKDLERRFLVAADNESVDEAMALLKELDQYMTPDEAGPLQEVARGVIGKSRENLAARFKLLVQDHEYAAAADLGQRIIAEFPNTRMAQEVREVLPQLRTRAGMS